MEPAELIGGPAFPPVRTPASGFAVRVKGTRVMPPLPARPSNPDAIIVITSSPAERPYPLYVAGIGAAEQCPWYGSRATACRIHERRLGSGTVTRT